MEKLRDVIQTLIQVNSDLIDKKIDIETAKQVCNNTQVIINGAKVYVDYAKLLGSNVEFIDDRPSIEGKIEQLDKSDQPLTVTYIQALLNLKEPEANKLYHFAKNQGVNTRHEMGNGKELYKKWCE